MRKIQKNILYLFAFIVMQIINKNIVYNVCKNIKNVFIVIKFNIIYEKMKKYFCFIYKILYY